MHSFAEPKEDDATGVEEMAILAIVCHPWYFEAISQKCTMQTMNISLPDQLKEFVDDQVGSGRYSSVSEYVRDLIRDDEKRKAQEKLETLLMEGIQSSEPTEMTRQDWDEIRREAVKQFERRKSRKSA
jgi:antitoxin ParD1/3/4